MKSSVWGRQHRWHPINQQTGPKFSPAAPFVFRDRTTGTLYLLTHDAATDAVTLVTPVPARANGWPIEPVLAAPAGSVRLYVDSGALRYEILETSQGPGETPVFTLNAEDPSTTYKLHASSVETFGDPLCLIKYTGVGTTTVVTDLGCDFFVVSEGEVFEEGVFEEGVFV